MKPHLYMNGEFLNRYQHVDTSYNLFGVINHYGSLSYGHYTSVVKNPFSKKWFKYDDDKVMEVQESQIAKEHAYILFYIRKDVEEKHLDDIMPKTSTVFPGKPVRTSQGKGYELGAKQDADEKTYYVKIRDNAYEVPVSKFV